MSKVKENLIKKYSQLANDLLDYTTHYWDDMNYDIEGYYEALNVDPKRINTERLKTQIEEVENLIKAHNSITYTFA